MRGYHLFFVLMSVITPFYIHSKVYPLHSGKRHHTIKETVLGILNNNIKAKKPTDLIVLLHQVSQSGLRLSQQYTIVQAIDDLVIKSEHNGELFDSEGRSMLNHVKVIYQKLLRKRETFEQLHKDHVVDSVQGLKVKQELTRFINELEKAHSQGHV